MVKFEEALRQQIIHKWEKSYIDYDSLKSQISYSELSSFATSSSSAFPHKKDDDSESDYLLSPSSPAISSSFPSPYVGDSGLLKRQVNQQGNHGGSSLTDNDTGGNSKFREMVDIELKKVNSFFNERHNEYREHLKYLKQSCEKEKAKISNQDADIERMEDGDEVLHLSSESLKRAFADLYKDLNSLKSFGVINYTGFVKISKKGHKANKEDTGSYKKFLQKIERLEFAREDSLNDIILELENVFAQTFCQSNLTLARTALVMEKGLETNWELFRIGLHAGVCLSLLLWVLWDCIVDDIDFTLWTDSVLYVYRAIGLLIVAAWCWGINLYVWENYRINYMYIFQFDPRLHFDYLAVFREAMQMTVIGCLNFLLYFKTRRGDLHQYFNLSFYPLSLFVYFLYKVFFPISKRTSFFHVIGNMLISPFGSVGFAEFYAADVCTSLGKVFVDIAFSFCYFMSGEFFQSPHTGDQSTCRSSFGFRKVTAPILLALPLWWRLLQCLKRYQETRNRFPHIANAIKYAISLCLVLFATFHPDITHYDEEGYDFYQVVYIFTFFVSTIYTFTWDTYMDWGLGKSTTNYGLRHTLLFSSSHKGLIYFVAISLNLVLRFMWTLSLIPFASPDPIRGSQGISIKHILTPVLALFEIFRRCMWGMFRLENEHVNNLEGYRKNDFIPLHFESNNKATVDKSTSKNSIILEVLSFIAVVVILACISIYTRYEA